MYKYKRQYNTYLRQLKNLKNEFLRKYQCTEEDLEPLTYFQFEVFYKVLEDEKPMKMEYRTLSIIQLHATHRAEVDELFKDVSQ